MAVSAVGIAANPVISQVFMVAGYIRRIYAVHQVLTDPGMARFTILVIPAAGINTFSTAVYYTHGQCHSSTESFGMADVAVVLVRIERHVTEQFKGGSAHPGMAVHTVVGLR